jgi:hypothetical protein
MPFNGESNVGVLPTITIVSDLGLDEIRPVLRGIPDGTPSLV